MPLLRACLLVVCLLSAAPLMVAPVLAKEPGLIPEKPGSGLSVETKQGFMVPYLETIPGTDVTFEMVPVPGGKFKLGSPAGEAGRKDDEGPQSEIEVGPFWMGKYEITWAEYKQYMALYVVFKDIGTLRGVLASSDKQVQREALEKLLTKYETLTKRLKQAPGDLDAITAPTQLYDPSFTYESGEDPKQPAVTMTQYAAKQYTKWLSRLTGRFYSLPSEAQWEYACRAGSSTAYSFGGDAKQLGDYGWFGDNSDAKTHVVGKKKPNAFGLYDMHGNVAEWVLDGYSDKGYPERKGVTAEAAAIAWSTKEYPRTVRGGYWDSPVEECRSAARLASEDKDWKAEDPNLPLSPWWFTNDPGSGVGFRIVRHLNPPAAAEHERYWGADADAVKRAVSDRLKEGRGAQGAIDPDLPKAIAELRELLKSYDAGAK